MKSVADNLEILTEYELGRAVTAIEWVARGDKPITQIASRTLLLDKQPYQLASDVERCLILADQPIVRGFVMRETCRRWTFGFYRYEWAMQGFLHLQTKRPHIQGEHAHWVRGLLFGYDAAAIERFNQSSRRERASTSPPLPCKKIPSSYMVEIYGPLALTAHRRSNSNGKYPTFR
jgi:hypothetical protein